MSGTGNSIGSRLRRGATAWLLVPAVAVLVALGAPVAGSMAAAPVDLDTFPSIQRTQRSFPQVNAVDRQGYSTLGVNFPACADGGGRDEGPDPSHVWEAGYSAPGRAAAPRATLYPFRTRAQAKNVMRRLKGHVAGCLGLRTGPEDYSRYSRFAVPKKKLGNDRIGFLWGHAYEFEGGYSTHRDVWVRLGRTLVVTSVSRGRGKPSMRPTLDFARLMVKRAS